MLPLALDHSALSPATVLCVPLAPGLRIPLLLLIVFVHMHGSTPHFPAAVVPDSLGTLPAHS